MRNQHPSSFAPSAAIFVLAVSLTCAEATGRRKAVTLAERQVDYSGISHCPGGSIGDADTCTYEPTTDTVTSSVALMNSLTVTTTISVGIDADGFTAGASESFAQTWSTTDTFTEQNGDINVSKYFFIYEGTLKINYGTAQDGHYIWLTTGLEVFSADDSSTDTYSANVADCGVISQSPTGTWYYDDDVYASAVAGSSSTYTYSNDS